MKKKLFLALGILVLVILQVAVLDYFKICSVKPDLLLIAVLIGSFYFTFHLRWALLFSVFAGALKDAFGSLPLGINTILFPLWSYLIVRLSKKLSVDNDFILVAVVVVAVALNGIMTRLVFFALGYFVPAGVSLRIVILEPLFTAFILFLIFRILKPRLYIHNAK